MICNEIQNTLGASFLQSLTYEAYCEIRPKAEWKEYMSTRRLAKLGGDGNSRQITYKYGKQSLDGRVYSRDKSIQQIPKEIRSFLLPANSKEVDISNCHPCIFQYLCDMHNVECKGNLNYITNRDQLLSESGVTKKQFLTLFNCDRPASTHELIDSIILDIFQAKKKLTKLLKDEYQTYLSINNIKNNFKNNPVCSFIWHKITSIENIILQDAIRLTTNPLDHIVPLYDGFITNVDIDLPLLNDSISKYNYIKFSIKSCSLAVIEAIDYPEYDPPIEVDPIEEMYDKTKDDIKINITPDGQTTYFYNMATSLWKPSKCILTNKAYFRNIIYDLYIPIMLSNRVFYSTGDPEYIEITKKIKAVVDFTTSRDNIATKLVDYHISKTIEVTEFDDCSYLLHFKNNCVFNLITMEIEPRIREHYATYTANELVNRTDCEDEINALRLVIESIFPVEETRDDYFRCVVNSFSGRVLERFFLLNGTGANGKGLISGLLENLLGSYSYVGLASIFNSALEGGANPQVARMNRKRFCIFRESDESKPLVYSVIKTFTGDGAINARLNYSNNTDCRMAGIKMMEVNKQPVLDGEAGNSMIRRQVNIEFEQEFADNPTGNQRQGNNEYKTSEWNDKHASPLFWLLYDFMVEKGLDYNNMSKLILSTATMDKTKEFIQDNNPDAELLELIESSIISDPISFIVIRDLHSHIKNITGGKETFKYSKLWKYIKQPSTPFKFKDIHYVNGKKNRNVLMGYKIRYDDDEDMEFIG